MPQRVREDIVIIGAGAAGLMAARELARAGKRVTIIEARTRCGGRIDPLPIEQFGYAAEGGAEFVHGEAPVTRALLTEAGLKLQDVEGRQVSFDQDTMTRGDRDSSHEAELREALRAIQDDVSIATFLREHFSSREYEPMRRSILRMVEGYDAADPERASTLALREEWLGGERHPQARIIGGYACLLDHLQRQCVAHDVAFRFGCTATAVDDIETALTIRCSHGETHRAHAAVLTVPLPLLGKIALPPAARMRADAAGQIGYGNVIKLLLRFESRWWIEQRRDLSEVSFLLSQQTIPVWWTQYPAEHAALTGWLGGPRTARLAGLGERELIEAGLDSLAHIFKQTRDELARRMLAARAINWANDPFALGAYSYATPQSRKAQAALAGDETDTILFSGEALYRGRDMGTVEAALASGLESAQRLLR